MSELSATMPTADIVSAESHPTADLQLMQRIAAGDEAALALLIQNHGETLARTIGRLNGWSRDSDDILQEVLITIWRKASQFDGSGSLEGWLKRIAINRCRNQFRLTGSIQRKLERFAEWLGGHSGHSMTFDESKRDDKNTDVRDQVHSALARLSGDDRTVLVLFYLEEMSGEDVARAMQVSVRAVHVRLYRARKRLKKILENETSESN